MAEEPGPVPVPQIHDHAHEVPEEMINVDSGEIPDTCFLRKENRGPIIRSRFVLNCTACCWSYLLKRNYRSVNDTVRRVKFDSRATTSCLVNGKPGVRRRKPYTSFGVVMTYPDLNLSAAHQLGPRPFAASITYQLYGTAPPALAMDEPMTARIEAISVNVLTARQMKGSFLNYADAAMLELFRQAKEKPSLKGRCCWPLVKVPAPEVDQPDDEVEQSDGEESDGEKSDGEESDDEESDGEESDGEESDGEGAATGVEEEFSKLKVKE